MTAVVPLYDLNLRNGRRSSMLELVDALSAPPQLVLTMDGACTLTLVVADAQRKLLRSPLITEKSWSEVAGIRFEQVAYSKSGNQITLTYEDSITAALRRRDDKLKIPANTSTRRGIVQRLAHGIPTEVDPAKRSNVHRPIEVDADTDTWDVLGDLADEINWRRFSTGKKLIVGSDDWLMDESRGVVNLVENTGAVGNIDVEGDSSKRKKSNTARVTLDTSVHGLEPGQLVRLGEDMGPGAGKWLVSQLSHPLVSHQATATLTRPREALKEPKGTVTGEHGERDFLPGVGDGTDGGGTAANAARGRMVAFALAQVGKPYVWGASGPSSYDCSGLVQAATAAAGHTLPKPSASQAAAVRGAGKALSIDTAIRTRGALLFIQTSSVHHVVISLGNGSTVEAMGSAYGVCIGGTAGRGWTSAGYWV